MATLTITEVTRCAGGNHIEVTATVNGRTGQRFQVGADELLETPDGISVREQLLLRVRSAILESGAVTPQQQRAAILNQEYKV
jgi:hypothetical protein